ncbi:RraA family protein [Muricoccus radiodurans]|uniref:RraA family protein n=1 Tax=Muricoccus radiodurans TaxID=2231721 RepID=UPI003CF2675E
MDGTDDPTAFGRLRQAGSGVISDCMMRLGLHGWMDGLHPVGGGERFAVGRARTLLFGPKRGEGGWSKTMYATIAGLSAGEILVFGTGATKENLMGDNMASFASRHRLAAMVTDSTVRDSAGIAALPMPVYSAGTAVRLPMNIEPVALDVPLNCGGAQVRPGDVVVANEDGVLIIPAARLADVLHQAEDVLVIETALQAAIAGGAPLAEIEALVKRKKVPRA